MTRTMTSLAGLVFYLICIAPPVVDSFNPASRKAAVVPQPQKQQQLQQPPSTTLDLFHPSQSDTLKHPSPMAPSEDPDESSILTKNYMASSLMLNIPDPETLKIGAGILLSGTAFGAGIAWSLDEAAAGFRKRFFERLKQDEATKSRPTLDDTPEQQQSQMQRTPKPTAIVSTKAPPTVPATATATATVQSVPIPAPAAPAPVPASPAPAPAAAVATASSNMEYLSNISGGSTTSAATKQSSPSSFAPSKWSPSKGASISSGYAGGNSYLSTMSSGSATSPPVSYSSKVPVRSEPQQSQQQNPAATVSAPTALPVASLGDTASSGNAPKKSYSVSNWSPSKASTSSSGFNGQNSYFGTMASSVSSPSYSSSTQTTTAQTTTAQTTTTAPPAPVSAAQAPAPEIFSAASPVQSSGNVAKKSYAMSKWSPNKSPGNSGFSGGNSYLGTMASSGSITSPSYSTPAPASTAPPAPVSAAQVPQPETFSAASPVQSSGNVAKKSYGMSKWSPDKSPVNSGFSGGNSYLGTMASSGSITPPSYSTPAPACTAPPAPVPAAPLPQPQTFTSAASPASLKSGGNSAKKSYTMSKWSPSKPARNTGYSGENTYFGTMASSPASSYPSPAPQVQAPAPLASQQSSVSSEPQTLPVAKPAQTSSVSASVPVSASPKNTYSMSKWSPNKPSRSTGYSGGNSYFGTMAASSSSPSYASPKTEAPAPVPSPVPAVPQQFSTAPTLENKQTFSAAEPAKFESCKVRAKKHYSMSKWSPGKPAGGSGFSGENSYFGTMTSSSSNHISTPTSAAPAPASAAELQQEVAAAPVPSEPQTISVTQSNNNAARTESAPKKSYAMSKWSPNKSAVTSAYSGGNSYFGAMANSNANQVSSSQASPAPSLSVNTGSGPATLPSLSDTDNASSSKSYSSSKWNPSKGTSRANTGTGSNYLSNMGSSVQNSPPQSYSSAPEPVVNSSPPGSGTSSASKSYPPSKWSPSKGSSGSSRGTGSGYFSQLDSRLVSASVTQSYPPPPVPAPQSAVPPPSVSSFDNAPPAPTPITISASSSIPGGSFDGSSSKSFSPSKWSPSNENQSRRRFGTTSSYFASMGLSSSWTQSNAPQKYGAPNQALTENTQVAGEELATATMPRPATQNNYMMALSSSGGEAAAKKSYSPSKWSP